MRYLVVVEKGKKGYGAYVPDLPGCVSAGSSREETLRLIREAIEFHIEGMIAAGEPVPEPASQAEVVEIRAAEFG